MSSKVPSNSVGSGGFTPIQKGSVVSVTIDKLTLGGDGLARLHHADSGFNLVVFVPYSAAGDHLKIKIVEIKKNFARGKILEILSPSPHRVSPPCPYFFTPNGKSACGGCNFQHLKYSAQTQSKVESFRETLVKIAKLNFDFVLPVLGDPSRQWRYRNKIQIPFRKNDRGKAAAGFFSPQSHHLVSIEDCHIHSETVMRLINSVRQKIDEWGLMPYEEKTHSGWLRHLLVREDFSSGEILVVLVTRDGFFPHARHWGELFQERFPQVIGLLQNINPDQTNVILGKKWNRVFGRDFLIEKLAGLGPQNSELKLKVSASSFFQVNTAMARVLYQTARDFALTESKRDSAIDLYCGVGGIGLALAPHFEKVVGVEESSSSISDAKENQELNGLNNCEFICSSVESFLVRHKNPVSAVVIDPPRAGCSEAVIRKILKLSPESLVYVSCEPSTLARDLRILCESQYAVQKIQPVDLFPQSSHIESVTLLRKKS